MLSYRLGTVNDIHWGLKPVFSTFFGEEKEINVQSLSSNRPKKERIVWNIFMYKICWAKKHMTQMHKKEIDIIWVSVQTMICILICVPLHICIKAVYSPRIDM